MKRGSVDTVPKIAVNGVTNSSIVVRTLDEPKESNSSKENICLFLDMPQRDTSVEEAINIQMVDEAFSDDSSAEEDGESRREEVS